MSGAPILKTERLTLRPMTMADWPDYAALWETERSVHMGGPAKADKSWGYFCSDAAMWDLFGHGALMIDDAQSGDCYGQVAINHGPWFPEKELGWMLYPSAEGKGIAYEAAKAMLDWAFSDGGLETLVSYIDPDNERSIALAKKLGATLDRAAPRPDPDDLVFRHTKP
ncbi:MAG: GNAT family N-acetyltransferase [Pseudomonadota bacterium]|nr:GNAT family N-acetyltransferase [Pseudomonadota bacterium]